MTNVAGYFDSEDAVTRAMETLMNTPGFQDVETLVYSNRGSGDSDSVAAFGRLPQTSGGTGSGTVAPVPVTGWRGGDDWFNDLGDEEQRYFQDAMRSGTSGVLALAKVDDDQVDQVRRKFSQIGARTFAKK